MSIGSSTGFLALSGLFMAAACLVQPAHADTISIAVETTEYMPEYATEDGVYKGFFRDLFDAFAKAKGHTVDYKPLPIVRGNQALINGEVDAKFPDNAFWAQDMKGGAKVVYSDPVIAYIDGVSVLPDKKGAKVEEMKTLGTVTGFTPFDYLDLIKAGKVEMKENPSLEGLIQQALAGRVDGAYASVAVINYQLDKMGKSAGLVFAAGLPHTKSGYSLSSIKHPELVAEFNQWMKDNASMIADLKAKTGAEKGVE